MLCRRSTITYSFGSNDAVFQTRRSIRKHFPLGAVFSVGDSNPMTVHSVNSEVFPMVWSLFAETMIVDGELSRSTKETVALRISKKNQCPMSVSAHRVMEKAAVRAEQSLNSQSKFTTTDVQEQAISYAESLINETVQQEWYDGNASKKGDETSPECLNSRAKAEVALVGLLYIHLNRVTNAILGEALPSPFFRLSSSSTDKTCCMDCIIATMLSGGMRKTYRAGITSHLCSSSSPSLDVLPERLRGAQLAGEERAEALARIVTWVNTFRHRELKQLVPDEVLRILDDETTGPPKDVPVCRIAHWANGAKHHKIKTLPAGLDQLVAMVLILVSYSPQSVFPSTHWTMLIKTLGEAKAKSLVIWWSLRWTLKRAKGLSLQDFKS